MRGTKTDNRRQFTERANPGNQSKNGLQAPAWKIHSRKRVVRMPDLLLPEVIIKAGSMGM